MKLKKRTNKSGKYCYMCGQFMDNPINRAGIKICRVTNRDCDTTTLACENFHMGKIFYCNKKGQWMDLKACFFIRKTKQANCGTPYNSHKNFLNLYQICTHNCVQGQQIQHLYETFDLENGTISFIPYEKPLPKPVQKIKAKIQIRKKLIRRTEPETTQNKIHRRNKINRRK